MAKILVQIIIAGSQIIGRALAKALREEIELSNQKARQRYGEGRQFARTNNASELFSVDEAKKILDLDKLELEKIQERFQKLYEVNSKEKSGSFYLQCKVSNAKERLEEELEKLKKNSNNG